MNKVILLGRLTKDPEIRQTKTTNTLVADFTLAINSRRKNQENNATFLKCVAYGTRAEIVKNNLSKGKQVVISGEIQTRTYKNKLIVEILVSEIYFTGRKEEKTKSATTSKVEKTTEEEATTDDLPF